MSGFDEVAYAAANDRARSSRTAEGYELLECLELTKYPSLGATRTLKITTYVPTE